MKSYIIVTSDVNEKIEVSANRLQNRVNSYLKEGFVPVGGIAVAYDSEDGSSYLMQAMIKKE